MGNVLFCVEIVLFSRKIGVMLLLSLKGVYCLVNQSDPIIYSLLFGMLFYRLEVKPFLAALNFQHKVISSSLNFNCLSVKVEELFQRVFCLVDPEFVVEELHIVPSALNQRCVTEEIQEKNPSCSI